MRKILFRGKQEGNGEWVYGLLTIMWGQYHIIDLNDEDVAYPIDPSTVGQFTGLTDKNGTKIFEGDIVKFKHGGEFAEGGIYFRNYAVEFVNTFVTYGLRLRNRSIHFPFKQATAAMHDVEVIGNIHDNPELLEVKNA